MSRKVTFLSLLNEIQKQKRDKKTKGEELKKLFQQKNEKTTISELKKAVTGIRRIKGENYDVHKFLIEIIESEK